jgi:hypothetical protein
MSHAMMTSQVFIANLLNGPTIYRKLGNANIARTYRSLQVYQRLNTQVGQRVLSDFTPTNVRPNCPTNVRPNPPRSE